MTRGLKLSQFISIPGQPLPSVPPEHHPAPEHRPTPEHHPMPSTAPSQSTMPSVPSFIVHDAGHAPPPW